jgi:hypothetical protein
LRNALNPQDAEHPQVRRGHRIQVLSLRPPKKDQEMELLKTIREETVMSEGGEGVSNI